MYLLDTMVISERGKRNPDKRAIGWLDSQDETTLLTSALVFGEIAAGIEKKRVSDPGFAQRLSVWSEETQQQFRHRTLPVTTRIAIRWGRLAAVLQRRDMDLLIAATALEHDLVVVTRNIRHFEPTGAKLLNPYEA